MRMRANDRRGLALYQWEDVLMLTLVAVQIAELKAVHAQQLTDMRASMTSAIEDYEHSAHEAQRAAREEVRQAIVEHCYLIAT